MSAILSFIVAHWISLGSLSGIGIASVAYPPFGLIVLGVLKAVLAEVRKLSPSELGCIGLGIALVWCASWGNHWKAVATERQASLVKLHATLDSISTKRDVQKQVSTRTVEKVVQDQVQVRTIVQHIHDAPNPPDCGTPDLPELKNEL